jgi:hypothetical protein
MQIAGYFVRHAPEVERRMFEPNVGASSIQLAAPGIVNGQLGERLAWPTTAGRRERVSARAHRPSSAGAAAAQDHRSDATDGRGLVPLQSIPFAQAGAASSAASLAGFAEFG